jgi:nicotinate-nucleotide adenylyltransferase
MDIGVLGGTFDPVHNGHIAIAGEAVSRLKLAQVIFIPAGQPWLKVQHPMAPAVHRVEMVKLAIKNDLLFSLSMVEIEKSGPSYTVDTMVALQEQFGAETRLYFLMGSDALASISLWKEPERLVQMCTLVAFTRQDNHTTDVNEIERTVPGIGRHVILVDIKPIDISSTDIRERVAKGLSIRGLVPLAVEQYIYQHGLYR